MWALAYVISIKWRVRQIFVTFRHLRLFGSIYSFFFTKKMRVLIFSCVFFNLNLLYFFVKTVRRDLHRAIKTIVQRVTKNMSKHLVKTTYLASSQK